MEEARQIIARAVLAPEKISAIFRKNFGPQHGIDLQQSDRSPHDPTEL